MKISSSAPKRFQVSKIVRTITLIAIIIFLIRPFNKIKNMTSKDSFSVTVPLTFTRCDVFCVQIMFSDWVFSWVCRGCINIHFHWIHFWPVDHVHRKLVADQGDILHWSALRSATCWKAVQGYIPSEPTVPCLALSGISRSQRIHPGSIPLPAHEEIRNLLPYTQTSTNCQLLGLSLKRAWDPIYSTE